MRDQQLAGQTVCLAAGTYKWLWIKDVQGEPGNPVTLVSRYSDKSIHEYGFLNAMVIQQQP